VLRLAVDAFRLGGSFCPASGNQVPPGPFPITVNDFTRLEITVVGTRGARHRDALAVLDLLGRGRIGARVEPGGLAGPPARFVAGAGGGASTSARRSAVGSRAGLAGGARGGIRRARRLRGRRCVVRGCATPSSATPRRTGRRFPRR
jgi:hypothetical protein